MPRLAVEDLERSIEVARAMQARAVEAALYAQHLRAEARDIREGCRLRLARIRSHALAASFAS